MNILNTKERAFKNIFYSLLSFGWPIIIAFIFTPIIVKSFGIKEYGIYIFINTLISLAGLLDLGVSTAISKFIAERRGSNDVNGLRELFKTANTLLIGIGAVGAVLIAGSIFLGLATFPGDVTGGYQAYIPSFIYAGILFFISSINSIHVIIPTAYQRFDIGAKIGMVFITLQQSLILLVAVLHGSINELFLLQSILMFIFYFIYKKYTATIMETHERPYLNLYGWNKKEALGCYKFGIVLFLNNLAGVSLTYLDRMIIPLFLGPSNLTYYSLPGGITNKIPNLSTTLSSIIFPMTAHFEGGGNREMTKNLYIRSMRLITIISTALTITFIAFAYEMLKFWISIDLAEKATGVLIILSLTNLILAVMYPLNTFLLGLGKLKALSITSIVTAITNGVLLIVLLPHFGIIGAAWAYLLALIPYFYLLYITEKSYLELTFRGMHYIKLLSQLLVTASVVYCIDTFILKAFVTNFPLVLIASGISCVLFIVLHYTFGFFEKEDTDDIYSFLKNNLLKKVGVTL